jgi:tripartite-type tricarboxylate transporter receptor subunit TctC
MTSTMWPALRRTISGALIVIAISVSDVGAQPDSFYRTNKLILGASSAAGSSYDAYMRLLARHMGRHIPGAPSIIVQNVPAGGGLVLANTIYTTAPKDGTYIGVLHGTFVQDELFGSSMVRFEGRRFAWIGNMMSEVDTCVMSTASGVNTVDDFFTREVLVGATSPGSQGYSFPIVYNGVLGTRFKVVAGYGGTPERVLAMGRGEIHGACGITTTSFGSIVEQAAKEGKVRMIAQAGKHKDEKHPDVPNMLDLAKTPADRQALEFLVAPLDLGRPIAAPPETPPQRLAILRRAFDETMRDPEMLDEAARLKMKIEAMNHVTTANMVGQLYTTPKSAVDRIAAALTGKPR